MYTIAQATTEDIPGIKDVLKESWLCAYGAYLPPETIEKVTSSWHNPKVLTEQIKNPNCYFAIAKEKTKVVGIVTARRTESGTTLMIDRLYILPISQGQGIGTSLLNKAIKHFPGIKTVYVDVEEMNKKSIEFYKKHGFKEFDVSEEKIGDVTLKIIELVKRK